jgi:homoserine O-acetyltransferase
MGSYGPSDLDSENGNIQGTNFPVITINDMVNAQYNLLDHFGIDKLFSVAGGSMGGMQVLQFISNFPDKSKTVIPIATTSSHSAQNIAFNELGRQAIMADSNWKEGDYSSNNSNPGKGLAVAENGSTYYIFIKKRFAGKIWQKITGKRRFKIWF